MSQYKTFVLICALVVMPLIAQDAHDAKSVHEAEKAERFNPEKIVLRGDSEGGKMNFKVGEEMTFKFSISYGKQQAPQKPFKIRWRRFGDDGKEFDHDYKATAITPDKPVRFKTTAHSPGFVTVRVWLLDSEGNDIKINKRPIVFTGALGAEIEKIKTVSTPKDFSAFWKSELEELAKVPMRPTLTSVSSKDPKVAVWRFTIPCVGGMPSTGYLYMPVGAKAKSLKAVAFFSGYGQPSDLKINYREGRTKLVISVSRFGIKQGQSKEYYKQESKKIGKYGFINNEDRKTSYFNGMILRDYRALEYIKSRKEWNGKDLTVTGGSMGGLQSLWMAGLDPKVTEINVFFPWCCNLKAQIDDRLRSEFAPKYTPALGYYDAVNFAKRIPSTATLTISTGLGDRVCPVTGVTMAYLAAPCAKTITYIQAATHAKAHSNPQKFTLSAK